MTENKEESWAGPIIADNFKKALVLLGEHSKGAAAAREIIKALSSPNKLSREQAMDVIRQQYLILLAEAERNDAKVNPQFIQLCNLNLGILSENKVKSVETYKSLAELLQGIVNQLRNHKKDTWAVTPLEKKLANDLADALSAPNLSSEDAMRIICRHYLKIQDMDIDKTNTKRADLISLCDNAMAQIPGSKYTKVAHYLDAHPKEIENEMSGRKNLQGEFKKLEKVAVNWATDAQAKPLKEASKIISEALNDINKTPKQIADIVAQQYDVINKIPQRTTQKEIAEFKSLCDQTISQVTNNQQQSVQSYIQANPEVVQPKPTVQQPSVQQINSETQKQVTQQFRNYYSSSNPIKEKFMQFSRHYQIYAQDMVQKLDKCKTTEEACSAIAEIYQKAQNEKGDDFSTTGKFAQECDNAINAFTNGKCKNMTDYLSLPENQQQKTGGLKK